MVLALVNAASGGDGWGAYRLMGGVMERGLDLRINVGAQGETFLNCEARLGLNMRKGVVLFYFYFLPSMRILSTLKSCYF